MKFNISQKLISIIAAAIILSSLSISVVSLYIFDKNYTQTIDEMVETSEVCGQTLLDEWATTLISEGKMIATQRTLQAELEEGLYDSLKGIIQLQKENVEADYLFVVNNDGEIVAGDIGVGENISDTKIFKEVMKGQDGSQWLSNDFIEFGSMAAVPVKRNNRVVGAIVTGYDFSTNEHVDYFKTVAGSEFTIFKDDLRVSTTLMADGQRLVGTKLGNKEIEDEVLVKGRLYDTNVRIRGTMYRCIYSPLRDDDGEVKGMLFVGKSQEIITTTIRHVIYIVLVTLAIIFVAVAIISSILVHKIVVTPILTVKDSLVEIASGDADLTKRIDLHSHDEIGEVVRGFNSFVEKLQEIVHSIRASNEQLGGHGENVGMISTDTANAISEIVANVDDVSKKIEEQNQSVSQTAGAVNEISSNIDSLNRMIEGQASGIAQASSAVEEMIGNISSVTQSVEKMAESFDELNENANIGFKKQQDVNDRVKEIETQSEMLQEANQTISAIAEQTNLLAMNAAIEAAHAGDAGKGFSVVADEIRKLSETSTVQSKTIGEQLSKIKNSIEDVVTASNESSQALNVVADKIKSTDELVIQIRTAMEEQTQGSKQISEALRDMNNGSSEVRSASVEMAEGNKLILDEVKLLQNATMSMKESMNQISGSTNKIKDTGAALGEVTTGLKDSILHIGGEINKFKV